MVVKKGESGHTGGGGGKSPRLHPRAQHASPRATVAPLVNDTLERAAVHAPRHDESNGVPARLAAQPATECLPLPGESKWLLIQHSSPLEILIFEMFQKKRCMVCFISFSSLRRSVVIETKRSCRYDHSGSRFSRSSLSELSTTTFHRRSHFPASKWYWLSSEHTAQN